MPKKERARERKLLKEEKNRLEGQMNQIFNIAEAPLMSFISEFLGENPGKIFHDEVHGFHEPLILMPLDDYKKDICLKFTIKNITDADDTPERTENIRSLLKHEKVREGIGFLFYSIKSVYAAILSKAMVDNKSMLKIKMALDEDNWVFYPKYADDLSHKKDYLEASLGQNMELRKNKDQPKKILDDLKKTFNELVAELVEVNGQITPEILQKEETKNASFKDKVKIGIFIEDLHISDLPKPEKNMLNKDLPKINSSSYEEAD